MATVTGYCRGCNQRFTAVSSERCPQCGEQLTLADEGPTLDLDETMPGGAAPIEIVVPPDLSDTLIGSELSLYTIEEFLGRGGMAWVFRARHNMLFRACAVKLLSPDLEGRSEHSVELFLREARAAASLVHPHVVAVHNIGHAAGFHFIEMEFVPGQSLQTLFAAKKTLSAVEATGYLLQTTSALAEAHRQGLIHRDFKPSNILVRCDGVAKLADFGLAKRVANVGPSGAMQRSGDSLSGTPYYMAPELFHGSVGSRASDVYAVGVSYFYLLTGQFPFRDRNVARLAHLHEEQPVPDPRSIVPTIPEPAAELVMRAMAKEKQERYQTGEALHEAFKRVFTQLRSLLSIVTEAVEGISATVKRVGEVLNIRVPLENGRSQTIFVEETVSETWSTQIVRVFSICGPAKASYYERALELNAQVPHGSLAIEPIDGEPHFVMLNSYLRSTCNPAEIRQSILDIARWADDVENALTGEDRF